LGIWSLEGWEVEIREGLKGMERRECGGREIWEGISHPD